MDFNTTERQDLFLQMIREFAEKEVKPLAAEVDDQERFPMETVEKMAKLGLMGIPVPKQYGGAGADNVLYTMAVEELSRVCATTGVILSAHTSLCCAPILENGTEAQKQKYLPKLASGEWIGAFGLTEPNAGTDASAQQTTAVKEGDHYVLNGSKIFITNAGYAALLAVSLIARVPGLGLVVEFIRSLPTEHFKAWFHDWMDDKALKRAYMIVTGLWVGLFLLRLVVQVPLYLTNHVAALGVTRLLMGIPFWALAIWVSYLIIATPMHRHKVAAKKTQTEVAVDAELEPSATGKDDDAS